MTTKKKDNRVRIEVEPDGRFRAPIRLFRHNRYTVARNRDGQLVFTPVEGTAMPPKPDPDE